MLLDIAPLWSSALTEEEKPISEDLGSHSSSIWLGMWVALSASQEEVIKAQSAEQFLILLEGWDIRGECSVFLNVCDSPASWGPGW